MARIGAPLVAELGGYRCLMLDRPGWGGSDPVDYSQTAYRDLVADLMVEILDDLGVEKCIRSEPPSVMCGR